MPVSNAPVPEDLLRSEVAALRAENEALRARLERIEAVLLADPAVSPDPTWSRRSLLAALPVLAACAGKGAVVAASGDTSGDGSSGGGGSGGGSGNAGSGKGDSGAGDSAGLDTAVDPGTCAAIASAGCPLTQYMGFDEPLSPPPLDTAIRFDRRSEVNVPGYTHEIVSLIAEHHQPNSFCWPLYIELHATDHPDAVQDTAQSVGATVRLYNPGPGWAASYHTDLIHQSNGVSLGVNVELTRDGAPGGTALGVNIQNTAHSNVAGDAAVQIQGADGHGWNDGVRVDSVCGTAVHLLNSRASAVAGERGVWLEGRYDVGLDLGANNLRMEAGQRILLEGTSQVYLRYNPDNGRIEFVYEPRGVVGYIEVGTSTEHAL
jgi:hypothetical protein